MSDLELTHITVNRRLESISIDHVDGKIIVTIIDSLPEETQFANTSALELVYSDADTWKIIKYPDSNNTTIEYVDNYIAKGKGKKSRKEHIYRKHH